MDESAFARAVRAVQDTAAPPAFEAVAGSAARRRLRSGRATAAVVIAVATVAAPFIFPLQEREPEFALLEPPTTDWLLQTPDPAWIAHLETRQSKEP